MSCDCHLVAYVHCPQCKVICHCVAAALQTNVSKWHSSSTIITTTTTTTKVHPSQCVFGTALLDGRAAVTLTGSSAERHSLRLRLALASSQTPLWGKLIWIILHVYAHAYDIRIRSWTTAPVRVCEWVIERAPSLLLRLSMLLCETWTLWLCARRQQLQFTVLALVTPKRMAGSTYSSRYAHSVLCKCKNNRQNKTNIVNCRKPARHFKLMPFVFVPQLPWLIWTHTHTKWR